MYNSKFKVGDRVFFKGFEKEVYTVSNVWQNGLVQLRGLRYDNSPDELCLVEEPAVPDNTSKRNTSVRISNCDFTIECNGKMNMAMLKSVLDIFNRSL